MTSAANSNLVMRFLTAGVAGPAILALLFLGPDWGWFAFISFATLIGSIELYGMTHPGDRPSQAALALATLGVEAALWFQGMNAKVVLCVLIAVPFFAIFLVLARLGDIKTAATRVMAGGFGPIYLGGAMAALAMLKRDAHADGPGFVLLALMLSWLSDTGAYFAGRFLGKHKLYEAVSPKKTIEGALGGLGGALAGALLGHYGYLKTLPLEHAIPLALVGGALGQAGDLGESLLKRSFGVKDSGGIVPGHGGILDRVDALLVTASICYAYVLFVRS